MRLKELEIQGFKSFPDKTRLTIGEGITGLVGPNGSGKSTIIRHICGVYRPDCGEILVAGEPVYENNAVKERMFVIPDDAYYFSQASVRDMMRFYRGVYPQFDTERFEKLRGVFELDEKRPIRKMSKGMQKQAAFWLAISLRPDVLILDEPVDGLDPVMRRQVWSLLLADVAERGTTVLVSSHNLRELEDVCDRVGIINSGRMLLERGLSELQENVCKLQFVPAEGRGIPDGLDVMHVSGAGRLKTLIVRGRPEAALALLEAERPVFVDVLPLTLEEIFIYELGGAGHEIREIIL